MHSEHQSRKLTGALLIAVFAPACWATSGVVLDQDTKTPIAGVFVVGTWTGRATMGPSTFSNCYYAALSTTDAKGRFDLPWLPRTLNPLGWRPATSITIYKPGYDEVPSKTYPTVVYLKRRVANSSAFDRPVVQTGLGCEERNRNEWLPFLKALYDEQRAGARSVAEAAQAHGLLFEIESIELGEETAVRRANDRARQRLFPGWRPK